MNKLDIETALEQSLRRQVKAPRLDGRFDAAVWSRIAAQERQAPAARVEKAASGSARWMFIINVIGAAIALALIVYFGVQSLGGVDVNVPAVSVPELPALSANTTDQIARIAVWSITGLSLAIGMMFTSLGRRVRSELVQFL